jgi:hypothetical protein
MTRARAFRIGLLALPLLLLVSIAWAGSSNGTTVDWSALSGGGAPVAGGAVTLNGTLGQTAIGSSSGPGATLGAGFWYGVGEGLYRLYLPVVLQNF